LVTLEFAGLVSVTKLLIKFAPRFFPVPTIFLLVTRPFPYATRKRTCLYSLLLGVICVTSPCLLLPRDFYFLFFCHLYWMKIYFCALSKNHLCWRLHFFSIFFFSWLVDNLAGIYKCDCDCFLKYFLFENALK